MCICTLRYRCSYSRIYITTHAPNFPPAPKNATRFARQRIESHRGPYLTVPLALEVSGLPSLFFALSGSLSICVECFVSPVVMPNRSDLLLFVPAYTFSQLKACTSRWDMSTINERQRVNNKDNHNNTTINRAALELYAHWKNCRRECPCRRRNQEISRVFLPFSPPPSLFSSPPSSLPFSGEPAPLPLLSPSVPLRPGGAEG